MEGKLGDNTELLELSIRVFSANPRLENPEESTTTGTTHWKNFACFSTFDRRMSGHGNFFNFTNHVYE